MSRRVSFVWLQARECSDSSGNVFSGSDKSINWGLTFEDDSTHDVVRDELNRKNDFKNSRK